MLIGYMFKILKLLILLVNLCYFLSMFWLAFCKVTTDWKLGGIGVDDHIRIPAELENEFFLSFSGITQLEEHWPQQ